MKSYSNVQKIKDKKGFTLIELLVVVSIISLLTSLSFSYLAEARQKGRDTAKIKEMSEVKNAIQLYVTEKGYYPTTKDDLINSGYIASIGNVIYKPLNTNGSSCTSQCNSYQISVKLERNDNKVLRNDSNQQISSDCSEYSDSGGSSNDYCYDYRP